MSRYIDAETYEDKLEKYCDAKCKYTEKERYVMCGACELGVAFEILENTPDADVREDVRGEWIENKVPDSMLKMCNVCNFTCGTYSFNFCPNCGADMRGE